MEAFRPIKSVLCVYEGLRLAFLVWVFIQLQPEGVIPFPWLVLITPGAMFLLIAVFCLLDMKYCRIYAPLFLAGKGLSVITTMFWLFFAKSNMIKELLLLYTHSAALLFIIPGIALFLVLGDIISVVLVSTVMRGNN